MDLHTEHIFQKQLTQIFITLIQGIQFLEGRSRQIIAVSVTLEDCLITVDKLIKADLLQNITCGILIGYNHTLPFQQGNLIVICEKAFFSVCHASYLNSGYFSQSFATSART